MQVIKRITRVRIARRTTKKNKPDTNHSRAHNEFHSAMCFIIIEFVSNGFYFMSATLQKPKGYLAIEHAATLVIIIEPFWDERVEYFFFICPCRPLSYKFAKK